MSVVIETTLGDVTVDLYLEQRPVTCLNFLKLCKMKYYNFNLFHTIRSGFIAQTGDPTGEGSGGESVFGLLEGPEKRFFSAEKMPKIRHTDTGLLSMVGIGDMMVGSQFFFTLGPDLDSLDGVHCVIGEVTEGHEVLRKLNDVICDETHRPYQDVRITHTVILEDPFNNPSGFRAPSRSPSPSVERLKGGRIAPDEEIDETQGKSAAEVQEIIDEKEAKARATILEIIGDIPDADIAPPENVLFVCKLNPVTTDEDLEIIFSRFGKIVSCEVIRDKKSGDSLQYAFIEFSDKKSCEDAYFKMDNVLIDDRRIHVDFSQSVSKIKWLGKGRGVKHINDDVSTKNNQMHRDNLKRTRSKERDYHHRDRNKHDESKNKHRHNDKERRDKQNRVDKDMKSRRERSKSKTKLHSSKGRFDNNENNSRNHRERSKSRTKSNHSRDRREIKHHRHQGDENKRLNKHEVDKAKEINSSSNQSKRLSSPKKYKETNIHSSPKNSSERNNRNDKNSNKKYIKESKDRDHENLDKVKRKNNEESSQEHQNKKSKHGTEHLEAQTPPGIQKKDNNNSKERKKEQKVDKKIKIVKKKRKPSTSSSDSDSSDSTSSSSDSSSSSESDCKRKKNRGKKRKYSTSSSSSSDSSSSSSSSDSSSESSSSSSNSEPNKKKRNHSNSKRKNVKKSRNKL